LVPAVNRFLKSHTTGVFDPNDPNYATAVAALVAAKNRTGNLSRLTQLLEDNSAPNLDAVKEAYGRHIGKGYN
ncbi:hypothetical protein, partial [Enterobacter asburiae]|uniref:hypothetical protein n=1 Tax=Enterobacter asburiae TaxID=61645 RepID=UPI0019540C9F